MSSTSEKYRNFVCEPMGKKLVTELPGVDEVLGKKLADAGFVKARDVLGQHLVLKGDKESFQEWMKDTCNASTKQSEDCHRSISEWSKQFL